MSSQREIIWDSHFLVTMPDNSAMGAKAPPLRQQLQKPPSRYVISLKQHIMDVHKIPLDGVCVKHQLQNEGDKKTMS